MTTIHFVVPKGIDPAAVRNVVSNYHCWSDGVTGVHYGVAFPTDAVHPTDVVTELTTIGIVVLPSVHDSATIPATAATVLATHGVIEGDTTFSCATKIYV